MHSYRRTLKTASVAAVGVALLVLAGCSGAADEAGDGEALTDAQIAAAQAELESYRAGVFESPPTTGPAPAPDKNVWIVTYGLAATPGADFDRGAREAAEVLGWTTTSCDGEFSPSKWQDCYRQAIAAGADGLAIYVNDCASTQAALREAHEAGLKIASAEASDCSDQEEGAEPLFDHQLQFAQGTLFDWLGELLYPAAAKVTTELGADARIMLMTELGAPSVKIMNDSVTEYLADTCPGCQVVTTIDYTGDEFGAPLQEKVGQALLANPEINAIIAPYDDAALNALAAVRENGGDIMLTAGPGSDSTIDLIRSGELTGGYAQELAWEGWGVMDALNRLFNGEEPVSSGQGIGWIDIDNLPAEGESYASPIDYKAIYTKTFRGEG